MKFVQYTNTAVGAVSATTAMPLGILTQRCMTDGCQSATFTAGTSGANVLNINEVGKYRITYNATLEAAAVGDVLVALYVNNVETGIISEASAAAIGDFVNLTIDYVIRVCNNCSSIATNFPGTVQIMLGSTAVTGGVSNLVVEKLN